jgi:hypothetical protein
MVVCSGSIRSWQHACLRKSSTEGHLTVTARIYLGRTHTHRTILHLRRTGRRKRGQKLTRRGSHKNLENRMLMTSSFPLARGEQKSPRAHRAPGRGDPLGCAESPRRRCCLAPFIPSNAKPLTRKPQGYDRIATEMATCSRYLRRFMSPQAVAQRQRDTGHASQYPDLWSVFRSLAGLKRAL